MPGGASFWVLKSPKRSPDEYKGVAAFFNYISKPEIAAKWSMDTGYVPVNTPDTVVDQWHWQPLRINGNVQKYTTPQWGQVTPFALTSGNQFQTPGPDTRLLGDATLFTRRDEAEAEWKLITPIEDAWRVLPAPRFPNYAAGSSGPEAADLLIARHGWSWRSLDPLR